MEKFFEQETCDRCGRSLSNGRIMSMFNTETICLDCKIKETRREDYKKALDSVRAEEAKGNRDYEGIGF